MTHKINANHGYMEQEAYLDNIATSDLEASLAGILPPTQYMTVTVDPSTIKAYGQEAKPYPYPYPYPVEADPSGGSLNEPGKKADAGKDLPWLFQTGFANALEEVVKVTTLGARKYTPNGWATVENGSERYMEGFARHASKLAKGETFDNGPGGIGTYHKAQMIWNLLASLELDLREGVS